MQFYSERCTIRKFQEDDIDAFMAYRNNMEWMQFQGFKGLTRQEYIDVLLSEQSLEQGIQLAIIDNTTHKLIGDIYLIKEELIYWIGYSICPANAKQGYAYEAVLTMINSLRDNNVKFIKASVDKGNCASIALLKKLNFLYEGNDGDEQIYALSL